MPGRSGGVSTFIGRQYVSKPVGKIERWLIFTILTAFVVFVGAVAWAGFFGPPVSF
jgi:hypothetical protein